MLDINLFRQDKGRNPELIRESQRRRFANVAIVDEIIALDLEGRRSNHSHPPLHLLSCSQFPPTTMVPRGAIRAPGFTEAVEYNLTKIAKEDATEKIKSTEETKELIAKKTAEVEEVFGALKAKLEVVGNLVHDSVPLSDDEANNAVIRLWGEKRLEPNLKNHVELVELLGIAETNKGADVAGGRGFYLKGDGVLLNQALINFGKRIYAIAHTLPYAKRGHG